MTITTDAGQRAIEATTRQRSEIDALFADVARLGAAQRRLERENETLKGRVEALEAKVAVLERDIAATRDFVRFVEEESEDRPDPDMEAREAFDGFYR